MKDRVEVLIVGAGPVGLALAVDCALRGLSFEIVDRAKGPSSHSKALALWSAGQEYLAALGVLEEMRREGIEPGGVRFRTRHREFLRIPNGAGVDSPHPRLLVIPQSATEQILRRRLAGLGHQVFEEAEFLGCEPAAEGLLARIQGPKGAGLECRCQYLAGCDGAHSAVRQAMGTRFEGRARPDTFILCDARLESPEALPPDVLLYTSRKGPLAMIPLRDKVWRVMSTRAGEAGAAPPTLEEMKEHLAERGPAGCELSNSQWLASFRVSERRAELFRQGRIVLAGDAAHIHSPVGGQGMNTGLLDAANLAWKLEAVLRHGGGEEVFLSSYHEERAHAADRVIRDSAARTRLAIGMTGIFPAALNLGAWLAGRSRKLRDLMAASLSGTSLQYPPSSVLGADTGWHEDWRDHGFPPGRLVRDVEVASEGGPLSLLALVLSARRMTLLLFSGRRPNYRDAAAVQEIREAVAASNFPVAVLAIWHGRHTPDESWLGDPEAIAHRRFGAYGRSACLVRPDAISALRTQPADWPRTCAFLESLYPRAACGN